VPSHSPPCGAAALLALWNVVRQPPWPRQNFP